MTDIFNRNYMDQYGNDTTNLSRINRDKLGTIAGHMSEGITKNQIRILVSIRQSIVRLGIASLLSEQPEFSVVGNASDSKECYRKALELSPHVLLCDLHVANECPVMMKNSDGRSYKMQADALPNMAAIVIMNDVSECQILEASEFGVRGYLTTNARCEDLYRAIHVVKAGGTFLERPVQSKVFAILKQMNGKEVVDNDILKDRERTILHLLAQGKSNQEIADTVFLSISSVKRYVSSLCAKLGASNRAEAVRIGISKQFIRAE